MTSQVELPAPEPAQLIHLHIAEYTAITNRNTYYMSVAFAFWPALIVYLTLIAYLILLKPGLSKSLSVSLTAIGSHLIVCGWYFCMVEQYKNVRYIETKLKPRLSQLLQTSEFWWYELERHSFTDIQWPRVIGDIWACALVLLPACVLLLKYPPMNRAEWLCCVLSISTGMAVLSLTIQTVIERRKFERGLRETQAEAARARGKTQPK